MRAILGAVNDGRIGAEAAIVISNRPDAAGLGIAKRMGVRTAVIEPAGEERSEYDERIAAGLADAGVTPGGGIVCLAGFMRILGPGIVSRYEGRILNIHPSLLPAFPGLSAQRQAIKKGVRVSGCTVHVVDTGTDTGPIIEQAVVKVKPDDTAESLAARIRKQEHKIYPKAVAMIVDRIVGGGGDIRKDKVVVRNRRRNVRKGRGTGRNGMVLVHNGRGDIRKGRGTGRNGMVGFHNGRGAVRDGRVIRQKSTPP